MQAEAAAQADTLRDQVRDLNARVRNKNIKKKTNGSLQCISALQMKGRWESNENVWFRFMCSQKWNCAALLFLKQNYNVLFAHIYMNIGIVGTHK